LVDIVLVVATRECNKCRACEAMVRRLLEKHPGELCFRKVRDDAPEADEFGVVMPPMLVVSGVLVTAGRVPDERGLAAVVERMLEGSKAK